MRYKALCVCMCAFPENRMLIFLVDYYNIKIEIGFMPINIDDAHFMHAFIDGIFYCR